VNELGGSWFFIEEQGIDVTYRQSAKAHEIIGSCDDMLEEMDLIEQVDTIKRNLQSSS